MNWDKDRYDDICDQLRPFLIQSGFRESKLRFAPVAAMMGVNLAECEGEEAKGLLEWYSGPTLVDMLGKSTCTFLMNTTNAKMMFVDKLEPPARDLKAPLRIPISNVFKGSGSGTSISGRLCGGVVQVGEKLRILPGDETAVVKSTHSSIFIPTTI